LTEFGQSVLVTGAGGYIGSALVKAIAAAGPSRLVLLDSCEQNLFEISRIVPGEAGNAPGVGQSRQGARQIGRGGPLGGRLAETGAHQCGHLVGYGARQGADVGSLDAHVTVGHPPRGLLVERVTPRE